MNKLRRLILILPNVSQFIGWSMSRDAAFTCASARERCPTRFMHGDATGGYWEIVCWGICVRIAAGGFICLACAGCGGAHSARQQHAPAQAKSTITRVEGTSTVVETLTATVESAPLTTPSSRERRREALDTGYYNCKQLPIALVRRAVRDPSYRPTFTRIVEGSLTMATGGQYMRAARMGCLNALKPRVADAEKAFAGHI